METITLIGRNSRLSLLQLDIVKKKIEEVVTGVEVKVIARGSRGDALPDVPLHTVEGSDFFTQDIFDALKNGEADIAVHSLKDMSGEHFFGSNHFAAVDRDDARDVVVLHPNWRTKVHKGQTLIIGTCSPRREEMAISFLRRALPVWNENFRIETKSIRGNVGTRLRKLHNGEYDGIILATAGLNRLLRSREDAPGIQELLADKNLVVLPLIECVPAPCQGAIVAEADPSNSKALNVLNKINDEKVMHACIQEKKVATQYGTGCLQKFGVTTIIYGNKEIVHAAGKDSDGRIFSEWMGLPQLDVTGKNFFSMTELMGSIFLYEYKDEATVINEPVVYVANYKAVEKEELINHLKGKRVWAAGTKTWYELARKGVEVEGCADALGLESLQKVWAMPLLNISKKDIAIVTNVKAAEIWRTKGWATYGTYAAKEKSLPNVEQRIRDADIIFWTSFQQYLQYKLSVKKNAVHVCSYGETAEQFKGAGIYPIVFPNIKAFQQWRQTSIHSRSVA